MDNTLIQIINQWIETQGALVRSQQENESLKAQLAELQKPKAEVVPGPAEMRGNPDSFSNGLKPTEEVLATDSRLTMAEGMVGP